MRGLRRHFFAAPQDLLDWFSWIEHKAKLEYLFDFHPCLDGNFPRWNSASEIENFGIADVPSLAGSKRFLIGHRGLKWKIHRVKQTRGKNKGLYHYFAGEGNWDIIYVTQGGVYSNVAILAGDISALGETENSRVLFKAFAHYINRWPLVEGSYYIGPEAERLARQGYRLVRQGVKQDPSHDVKLDGSS
jgi:hypothetical protein